ncbi:putative pumilio homolog 8, chloroplastic [Cryptomeria japonica]|uniref:putative pumilio homolog 8, chloroplastic n=1 Tax=Cryptomeria japonica TaxID=3369 RepID=UPI0025AD47D8|nr:putative pumilio homolog 8, chloroplastic [Cryptomeria japonica]
MIGSEQDDEEFEMLLGEIPRATSAPPHGQRVESAKGVDEGKPTLSEDTYVVVTSPLSSYYGGSGSSSSDNRNSPQSLIDQRSQLKGVFDQEQESGGAMSNQKIFSDFSGVEGSFLEDQALSDAFSNLSFKEIGIDDGKRVKLEVLENVDGGVLDTKQDQSSPGKYPAFNVVGTTLPTRLNVDNGSLNSPRTKSFGIHGSFQSKHYNGDLQSTGNQLAYPREIRTMKELLTHNAHGPDTYMNSLGLPFNNNCPRGTLDFQQPHPIYSVAPSPALGLKGNQVFAKSSMSEAETLPSIGSLQQQSFFDPTLGTFVQPQSRRTPISDSHQQMNTMNMTWNPIIEERNLRMQQELMLLQQAHVQPLAGVPHQAGATFIEDASNRTFRQNGLHSPIPNIQLDSPLRSFQLQGPVFSERDWGTNLLPSHVGMNNFSVHPMQSGDVYPMQSGDVCQYHAQGFCGRGENCAYFNGQSPGIMSSRICHSVSVPFKNSHMSGNLGGEDKLIFPEKILTRSQGINSLTMINNSGGRKDTLNNGQYNERALLSEYSHSGSFQLDINNHSRSISPEIAESKFNLRSLMTSQQPQPKYVTLDDVEGKIFIIAKDQHGCRFLQKKFDDGSPEDVHKIFQEIIGHIVELMTDPFGNYLVQKLLEVCNDEQRMQILDAVTRKSGELVSISLNMHGTRAVQKLIEILKTPQQVSMVISSLKAGVVTLIKDLNGNHVVQRCLQRLCSEDNQFLFDAAAAHCVEIATHRHGCCVLQRCIDHSVGVQKERLVAEIAANALVLSQDPFGNYVVQYVLDLGMSWVTADVVGQLNGNYEHLSMQKFSSNVVERCLKISGEEERALIVHELIKSSRLGQLLQDPFANYVVQCALTVSKGPLHSALVDAIRPHLPALRSSPFGKRILSRTNLKK